jgi:hypothetical protein
LGVRRRILVVLVAVAVALTALLVGLDRVTASFERDAKDVRKLHLAARGLLPTSAEIASETEGGCAELAAYPDCVLISFRRRSSQAGTLREVRELAAAQGWRNTGEGWLLPSGAMLVYEREGLRANVSVRVRANRDYVQVRFWP